MLPPNPTSFINFRNNNTNNPYLRQSGTSQYPPFYTPFSGDTERPFDDMTYFNKSQTFEGKLNKRGKINKAWKERWFVLDEYEQKMEYYPSKQDAIDHKHLCGTIDISLIQRIEIISNIDQIKLNETELLKKNKTILSKFIIFNDKSKSNQSYSFQLVMSGRTYIFSAIDSKSYIRWLNELCRVIYGGIVHEGILKKLGYRNKSWKSRYFTLNKYKLMKYYIDKTRKEFLGLIDLNLCILITNGKTYGVNLKYTIEIQTPNRTWIICAAEKQQKYEWEKVIKAVRWEKLNEQQTNNMVQQNLWKNHEDDIKAMQKNGNGILNINNNLMVSHPKPMRASTATEQYGMGSMGMGGTMGMGMGMTPNMMGMNGGMGMGMSMDDQMINIQKQMMMNNLMLANHLNAMNQTMKNGTMGMGMPMPPNLMAMHAASTGNLPIYAQQHDKENNNNNNNVMMNEMGFGINNNNNQNNKEWNNNAHSAPNSVDENNNNNKNSLDGIDDIDNNIDNIDNIGNFGRFKHGKPNEYDEERYIAMYNQQQNSALLSDDDEKFNEFEGNNSNKKKKEANNNDNKLKVQKVFDCWDPSVIGQTQYVSMESNNCIATATGSNHKRWYNLFSIIITERQVQYHWRVRVNKVNTDWVMIIGIMDTCYIDEYVQYNNNNNVLNKNYFAKSKYGYGIDASGNLQNGGKNGGKYCNPFKNGDIVDVYFDMKQFVLWYGLNGKEYGVACKVHESFYKCCVAMFGPKHCVQLLSCDTYFYP